MSQCIQGLYSSTFMKRPQYISYKPLDVRLQTRNSRYRSQFLLFLTNGCKALINDPSDRPFCISGQHIDYQLHCLLVVLNRYQKELHYHSSQCHWILLRLYQCRFSITLDQLQILTLFHCRAGLCMVHNDQDM